MSYEIHDLLGSLGVALIIGSYLLVQVRKLSATGLVYTAANGLGAALILFSLLYDFNLSAFMVEVFWLLISLYGMLRAVEDRRRTGRA